MLPSDSDIAPVVAPPCSRGADQRVYSQTTGLAKFSLSPSRGETPVLKSKKSGLPVYIPVENRHASTDAAPQEKDLLQRYATKQRQVTELERLLELARFEVNELAAQIKELVPELQQQQPQLAANKLHILKNKASNIFNLQPLQQPNVPLNQYLNKFQTQLNQTTEKIISRQALRSIVDDVGKNLDENNTKLFQFIQTNNTKTTKMFGDLISGISPVKPKAPLSKREVAESSFMFENLDARPEAGEHDEDVVNIFSANEYSTDIGEHSSFSSNVVDIDDYDSDQEGDKP